MKCSRRLYYNLRIRFIVTTYGFVPGVHPKRNSNINFCPSKLHPGYEARRSGAPGFISTTRAEMRDEQGDRRARRRNAELASLQSASIPVVAAGVEAVSSALSNTAQALLRVTVQVHRKHNRVQYMQRIWG